MAGSGHGNQEQDCDVAGLIRRIAADPGRHIPLPAMLNLRDVGGYPVAGGGVIAWRTLLRSDAPRLIDDGALDVLAGLNLRTVVDLRTSAEAQIAPSPLDGLADRGTTTAHVSLIGEDMTVLPADLAAIYQFIVDSHGAAIGAAIRFLARPGALPGLVHCAAGKDRTGIVVALALACAGVPDRFIAADYALSSLYLDLWRTPAIGRVRQNSGMDDRLTMALMVCPPELILGVLARARQRGGTIEGYLAGHGVTSADVGMLRAALVTTSSSRSGVR
ncbi:MAG TPA: tyrosine-protein phosphatase [Streptosporangiaceae bacterium]|nr:tyrosine-protein phosphatase [Streptosporangiaceae bacterium]